jgi:hypothetical protein
MGLYQELINNFKKQIYTLASDTDYGVARVVEYPNSCIVHTDTPNIPGLLALGVAATKWFLSNGDIAPSQPHYCIMTYDLQGSMCMELSITPIKGGICVLGAAGSAPVDMPDTLANTLTKQELVEVTVLTALIQKSDVMSQLMDTRANQTNRMIGEARFIANQYLNYTK